MKAFSKYEGLGNDFILLDGRAWRDDEVTPALAQKLCDRHRGIGGDGVLLVTPASDQSSARMVIYNADGSRPEMCGNGVRCVVAWLSDQGLLADDGRVVVESDAGPRPSTLVERQDATVRVAVEMGVAKVSAAPSVNANEGVNAVTAVDMGNPHGVMFAPVGDRMELVRAVTALEVFPHGVNVEFVEVTERGFRVRVHERGVGWTEACGTGACAVAAAAVSLGMATAGESISVTLDGGDLSIRIGPERFDVLMVGPARRVFAGALPQ